MVSRKYVSAFLLVVGVVLLALSAIPINEPASNYRHTVEYAGDGRVAGSQYEEEDVIDYRNLTERGQTVFDKAREQQEYVADNESETAPDFDYPSDTAALGHGVYLIRYEDRTYELTTQQIGDSDVLERQIAQLAAKLLGTVLVAIGAIVEVWRRVAW